MTLKLVPPPRAKRCRHQWGKRKGGPLKCTRCGILLAATSSRARIVHLVPSPADGDMIVTLLEDLRDAIRALGPGRCRVSVRVERIT